MLAARNDQNELRKSSLAQQTRLKGMSDVHMCEDACTQALVRAQMFN